MHKSELFFDRVSSKAKPEPNQTASKIIELNNQYLEKDQCILDFGCGAGAITNKLAKSFRFIEAIDISSGMITVAKKQAKENDITNINYSQTSIFDDRLKEETFDAILAYNVLHYIEDIPSLMRRFHSLLKPNGIFISSTACLKEKRSFIRYGLLLLVKLGVVPKIEFYKRSELASLITKEHFKMVTTERISMVPEYFIMTRK